MRARCELLSSTRSDKVNVEADADTDPRRLHRLTVERRIRRRAPPQRA